VRKVYGASTNVEGWAHYAEQMMIDEGFHAGDPRYRLAQLQDALLRNVRFIAGIKIHTQGMTIDEATTLFETQGHQPHAISVQEAKRGAGDPLYGYYTMGKLMILKLRRDYEQKLGAAYSLQKFHDAFIQERDSDLDAGQHTHHIHFAQHIGRQPDLEQALRHSLGKAFETGAASRATVFKNAVDRRESRSGPVTYQLLLLRFREVIG
jgi:hypothetical protein